MHEKVLSVFGKLVGSLNSLAVKLFWGSIKLAVILLGRWGKLG